MGWECDDWDDLEESTDLATVRPSSEVMGRVYALAEPELDESGADDPRHLWTQMGIESRRPLESRWAR